MQSLPTAARRILRNLGLLFLAIAISACVSQRRDERLHSTLWVQTSAEYAVSTRQVYSMASDHLQAALVDPNWSAINGVASPGLSPAIIVDVDETVLDNAGHAARAIMARESFNVDTWRTWVREAAAPAVPGAVDYLRQVNAAGVTIFYVSNRHHDLEEPTRKNLAALGCPIRTDIDVVLLREERPGWHRDKSPRRDWVARDFRVLQIVGDDLADFTSVPEGVDHEARGEIASSHNQQWGRRWFLLPNPIYGGWEEALMQGEHSRFVKPLDRKLQQLETR
ncbi:MAG: 5'-nucleotidase, lipoprotein e(P4) family [Gammaproteobacteria bacterium]